MGGFEVNSPDVPEFGGEFGKMLSNSAAMCMCKSSIICIISVYNFCL